MNRRQPSLAVVLVSPVILLSMEVANAGGLDGTDSIGAFRHTIEISPLSPFIHIYALQYACQFTPKDELVVGLSYMNIRYDFGSAHATAFIAGYRRFLWKNFHVEYQVWPAYDSFYEKNEGRYYKSFDVWNELRLGYRFDMEISSAPVFISVQWHFGFGLYASNKLQSFKGHGKENRFFYFPPLLFVGMRSWNGDAEG